MLEKYIQGCQKNNRSILWTDINPYKKFLKKLGDDVQQLLNEGSRLLVRIVAETLPYIVARHLEQGESIDSLKIRERSLTMHLSVA